MCLPARNPAAVMNDGGHQWKELIVRCAVDPGMLPASKVSYLYQRRKDILGLTGCQFRLRNEAGCLEHKAGIFHLTSGLGRTGADHSQQHRKARPHRAARNGFDRLAGGRATVEGDDESGGRREGNRP